MYFLSIIHLLSRRYFIKSICLFIIASFYGYYALFIDTDSIEFLSYVGGAILAAFQILGSMYVYKDFIGWDNFENSEGLSLKRKKTDK